MMLSTFCFQCFVLLVICFNCYYLIEFDERQPYALHETYSIKKLKFQGKVKIYNTIPARKKIADKNLKVRNQVLEKGNLVGDGDVIAYNPGTLAPAFSVYTLGGKYVFPSALSRNRSLIIHLFDTNSAFLECLWMSDDALKPIVTSENFSDTEFLFISKSAHYNQLFGAQWMKERLESLYRKEVSRNPYAVLPSDRFHFAVEPVNELGNFIPAVLNQWQCVDHLCGFDQVFISSPDLLFPVVLKRLDARYDWLPNPSSVFGNKTLPMFNCHDGCEKVSGVKGSVALVTYNGSCSFFDKITQMQASGAVAVIIMADKNQPVLDLNCQGTECTADLHIPVSMVPYQDGLSVQAKQTVSYQNTPSENFFMAIDMEGKLAEVGWFLFPNMSFLIWQAQWFYYKHHLADRIKADALNINIFTNKTMQGNAGVSVNVTLPGMTDLMLYKEIFLDMSLGCPGNHDTDCAHWDHTVNLYVCCDSKSPLCNMELGRWITPFRRRIGRWLSDVSPLLPLMANKTCTFTMKTAPWAMPWVPSLSIHFQDKQSQGGGLYPAEVFVLYEPGATFDKNYNSYFKPYLFFVPDNIAQVKIYAVITGHGSDENGCGEFCVTSHHFMVNKHINNITFGVAGTPLGCANQVPTGVEPNEHGTWLYGRDGWCDGRNVFPWVIDITQQVVKGQQTNVIQYFGWFNGTDPDPKQNPGEIILYSYLIFYKELNRT